MESRSEHSPPEHQGWNAQYFTQPPPPQPLTEATTPDANHPVGSAANTAVCASVREQLQALLENDGSVRAEASTALYGHLSVCAGCAREFEEMKRVVHMLESLPLAALPADYSRLVMRRIQTGQLSGGDKHAVRPTGQAVGLCDRVKEKLQPLLDDDATIRPEMVTALYGHLAVCMDCASEFARMRKMVNLLETMPLADLPVDYSPYVMRRILAGDFSATAPKAQSVPGPTFAASSPVSGGVANLEMLKATSSLGLKSLTGTLSTAARQTVWQRLLISVGLSGLFVYLLACDWGRQVLAVNLETARLWLAQIGEHLEQAPVFGALIVSLSAALSSMNEALSHSFTALGGAAMQTLLIELSIGLAACLLVSTRRKSSISGI